LGVPERNIGYFGRGPNGSEPAQMARFYCESSRHKDNANMMVSHFPRLADREVGSY
jgi:hypothetical protein